MLTVTSPAAAVVTENVSVTPPTENSLLRAVPAVPEEVCLTCRYWLFVIFFAVPEKLPAEGVVVELLTANVAVPEVREAVTVSVIPVI